jgi:outer membrane lipoprotein-sorting protein
MNRMMRKTIFTRGNVILAMMLLMLYVLSTGREAAGRTSQDSESPELQRVLKKIDEVAGKFRNFHAKFSQKKYTAILSEYDVPETGEFYYAYDKDRSVLMRHEITEPGKRILTIKGDSAIIYQPRIKQAQIASLGKRRNLLEYLGTGLGQTSASLRERFNLAYAGSDSINDVPCDIVVFHPKDPDVSTSLESITIWFNKISGTPVQYKLLEPNRDYLLLTFHEETLNGKISDSLFEQKLPNGVDLLRIN